MKKSRLFKNLVSLLVLLIFLAISLATWMFVYWGYLKGDMIMMCAMNFAMAIANIGIAFTTVYIVLSKFNLLSSEQIIKTKKQKLFFGISTISLSLLIEIICIVWYCFGYITC